ncbi:MAG: GTP-binding protein [Thermoplasmata archaeon]|nr:MAG: GTP-binding protein [Thermoplasmata archaeon]
MAKSREFLKKMCVVGEASVGKTSLIRKFVVDKFDDKYLITIGTKTTKKSISVEDDKGEANIKLMIWDLMGQSRFAEIQRSAYTGATGAFIVLDLTRKETLDTFPRWLYAIYKITGEIPVVVLANKNDLKPAFGEREVQKLVAEYDFPYYFTSAKTGENVDSAFQTLGKLMLSPWKKTDFTSRFREAMGLKMEREVRPPSKLTTLEVEDIITTRYCDLLGDPEYAMAIIREQFKRAKVNFNAPTAKGLEKVVDLLINAASDQVEKSRLAKERREYSALVRKIG